MFKASLVAVMLAFSVATAQPVRAEVQSIDVLVVPLDKLPSYGSVVSAWYGKPVYDPSEKKVGAITDMLFDANGSINAVMLNVGGFLGVGAKHVAVPVTAITFTAKNNKSWLTINTTKDILKKAVGYKFDKQMGVWNPE
ncbi:PRC-barrel domain-containing protein [Methylocystis sp. ATCC 49242]|uniref:PRC-barrel domain-containing protein n=1 Tax=Methylocystis sp. ATCC 49242 TaxID=622637 RepID=UPI0001F877C5|nr:PRC-barrel domain-containing protein [Methylocystis sp. ATCC 49242]